MAWTLAIGALLLAWNLVRRTVSAPTVLGIEPAEALESTGRLDRRPRDPRPPPRRCWARIAGTCLRTPAPPPPGAP